MKKKFITIVVFIISFTTEAQVSVVKVVDSLLLKGNYQKALQILENQDKKTTENLSKTAAIYQSIGNYSNAISYYKKALETKDDIIIKTKLAKTYALAKHPLMAIELYEQIIQKDSLNLLVANNLGKLYLSNYKIALAKKIYQYLQKKDTLNPNYPYQLGVALGRQKDFFKMGDSFLEAYRRDSLHIKTIAGLVHFYKDLKFKDSTVLFIDKGLKVAPNNINFNNLKANNSYTNKDYKTTLKHLKRLDSLGYKSVNMYELFGLCYLKSEDYDLAEQNFMNALQINPKNSTVLFRLASLYYKTDKIKKAKVTLMRSIYLAKPNLHRQHYLLATIFKEEGNLKMAIKSFKDAYQNNSKNYKALFELAMAEDTYYKEKKIAYYNFQKYIERFGDIDTELTAYAKQRTKEIKEMYFLEGVTLD